jgi:archaellum component FlaC
MPVSPLLAQGEPNPPMTVYLWNEDGTESVSQGPVGMKVLVNGTLSNAGAQFKIFWDYIKDWDGRSGFLVEGYADGFNYSIVITIPPAMAGEHYIIVEDEKDHSTKTAIFTVTPEITVTPTSGPSGINVTVEGYLINNETITLRFYDSIAVQELNLTEPETGPEGYFTANITIPQTGEAVHAIRAYLNDTLQAEAPFTVSYSISASPEPAPSGALVTISGVFAANENLTVSFANSTWTVEVGSAISGGNGAFSVNVTVPEASPGNYLIRAYNDWLTVESPFTISQPPQLFLNTTEIIPGKGLWIGGVNFYPNSTVSIYLLSEPLLLATANTTDTGDFIAETTIPEVSPGEHTIMAVDPIFQVPGNTTMTVHSVTIKPLSNEYLTNDVINFLVNSTTPFENGSVIDIQVYDPYGVPFSSATLFSDDIVNVNGSYVAPYYASRVFLSIPRGAPEGTWKWNATYSLELYPGEVFTAEGIFTVSNEPSVNLVLKRLHEMDSRILGIAETVNDTYVLLETTRGEILVKLDDLNASLTGIITDAEGNIIARIDTAIGSIESKLDDLNVIVTNIENNVATIQTDLGVVKANLLTVKSIVASMNGEISSIKDGVASIKSSVGSISAKLAAMDSKISDVKDGVAEIETSIGTLRANLQNLNASIISLNGRTGTIQTLLGSINVSVADLGAAVTSVDENLNATVSTTLGELKETVTSIEENIANVVIPDLGNIEASIYLAEQAARNAESAATGLSAIIYIMAAMAAATTALVAITLILILRRGTA